MIDLERELRGANFKQAKAQVYTLLGRTLEAWKPQQRYSAAELTRAPLFQTGLLWRIDEALTIAKRELRGHLCCEAADLVRRLTEWRQAIERWTQYDAAEAMRVLPSALVDGCVTEVECWYRVVALAFSESWQKAA